MKLTIENKLFQSDSSRVELTGISPEQWLVFFRDFLRKSEQNTFAQSVYLFESEKKAEEFYNGIKKEKNVFFFPELGSELYSSIIPSEYNLIKRFLIIDKIINSTEDDLIIITTYRASRLQLPPHEYFSGNKFEVAISDIFEPHELAEKLVALGYNKTPTTEEPGTFAVKGEIFDIYPFDQDPVRLIFFDNMIEEIYRIDPTTLITDKSQALESFELTKTQLTLTDKQYTTNFRNNFPRPKLHEKERYQYRETILKSLQKERLFQDYPIFIKYFFNEAKTLLDYAQDFTIFYVDEFNINQEYESFQIDLDNEYQSYQTHESSEIKPAPTDVYAFHEPEIKKKINISSVAIQVDLEEDYKNKINLEIKSLAGLLVESKDSKQKHKDLCSLIEKHLVKGHQVYLYYELDSARREIEYFCNIYFENKDLLTKINFQENKLSAGFYYEKEQLLFVSESDFFTKKVNKVKSKKTTIENDLFAEQLATLNIDDYIIHKEFGVGQYKGIETLELSGSKSDYIVIEYLDSDKVYVPVYKLNLLQKHANKTSVVSLANLKTKKFDQAKSKAKAAVKKLAFDLLELQAKRKMQKGFQFSEPDHLYNDFSLSFKFTETEDQLHAIEDVISDMTSERPMDRLVCGDVGFGKTEVAMRAAFKAVEDQKQIAILVPTTVLAFQHYNTFIERFKNVPINIEFISRFKTTKQVNEILEKVSDGKIDILIGTHKILSSKVKFNDLGLLIIDEEQRFGVGHKEKLKLLKENVDTLTLTATPIPRTLQMSFLGIKDLSVIKTPPKKRQSIKTYIIKEDAQTLKMAIEKELARGGQVYIVHNKVQDIEIYTAKIRELVPNSRIIYAHGQLPERELEKRITDFFNYKFDILISTTIIESGIDIPRANTMIIDRADTFGLSQLHQLRGRIGRSDKKAYAYFIVPSHKKVSDVAAKRLQALQTYASLGSGYSLATSDLEIRGSGDILGPEQSGHIANIGLELYMELLQDCINELTGETTKQNKNIEIQTQFSSYIPTTFIENTKLRLKYYKRISNTLSSEQLNEIEFELKDQFGKLPDEVTNLLTIIRARLSFSTVGMANVKVKSSSIILQFDQEQINQDTALQNKIVNFFTKRPKIYKINPDYSINCSFKDKIKADTLLEFAGYIAEQLK